MKKNEATVEARLHRALSTAFPTFREVKLEHQKSFSIKFGHHNVRVDLKSTSKNASRAILDILLTIDGNNTILLELKREGLKLTDEDVSQGISYGRLVDPMPPLTLISNGEDNWFFNTYTKERIKRNSVDLCFIQELTDKTFRLAMSDFKNAISQLLNHEPALFSTVINQITENKFSRLRGTIEDFKKPLCDTFQINRHTLTEVRGHIENGDALIGIVGSAFSGKTTVLYQFFQTVKSQDDFLLYLDCHDHNYSILQQLANHFSRQTKTMVDKQKIREWLFNSMIGMPDGRFYLLVDNFNNDIPEAIKAELIELIDIFKGENQFVLYSVDEYNFKQLAYVSNRQYKTIIGEQSKLIRLDELNDAEYYQAVQLMFDNYRVTIENGGHYTPEYREARVLRHLASISPNDVPEGSCTKIDAVPNLGLLYALSSNDTYTRMVHEVYQKITYCFIFERDLRVSNAELNIMASGTGAVSTQIFSRYFPRDLDTLIKSSIVVFRELPDGTKVIFPKFHELIAKYSIAHLAELMIKAKDEGLDSKGLCSLFIKLVTPVPYCDIVGSGVLRKISESDDILFSELVQEMLNTPPRYEKITAGTKILLYTEDLGHVTVNFSDDMDDEGFLTDFLPYVILSQLAAHPMGLVDAGEYSLYAFHLSLIYEVGSSKEFLRRGDARSWKNMRPLEGYDWGEVGYLVSGKEGIIEPIVQSIQACMQEIPDEIKILSQRAFEEDNVILLHRIYLAVRNLVNIDEEKVANEASSFVAKFTPYFRNFIHNFLTNDIQNPDLREELKERLSRLGAE